MSREGNGVSPREARGIPPAEWAVAAIGAGLVLVAVAVLVWDAVHGVGTLPDVLFHKAFKASRVGIWSRLRFRIGETERPRG